MSVARPDALAWPAGLEALLDDRTVELAHARRSAPKMTKRGWVVRRTLLTADMLGLILAFSIAQWLFADAGMWGADALGDWSLVLASLPLWVVGAKLYGLYDRDEERTDHSTVDDFVGVFHLVTVASWFVLAGDWLIGNYSLDMPKVVSFWLLAIVVVAMMRSGARAVCRRNIAYLQNTVIVGAGDVGQLVARKVLNHPEYGLNLVGFVDLNPPAERPGLAHLNVLGPPERLAEIVPLLDVDRVIVAFPSEGHESTLEILRTLRDFDVQIDIVPRMFEIVGTNVGVHTVEGLPLVGLPPLRLSHSSKLLKRAIDIAFALTGLVCLSPLLLAIAIWIKLDSRGPVLFRQQRIGSGDNPFGIFKFRTMSVDAERRKAELVHLNMHATNGSDPRMFKVPDDPRVTDAGCFLRRYSLDELPQLLNVLIGDMSLVGPRPLIEDEDLHVEDWARKRLDLKPGMTGLWQVLGASDIPFDEMTKLDYLYVTNWSLGGDLQLVFKTLPVLFRPRNAY
jgi:exopolysaccharide biosynthesis polyprenyl glycosylphosphotransferase